MRRRANCRTTLPRGRASARQRSGPHKRTKKQSSLLFRPCAPTWIRTKDHLLKRELLYQLSYGRERGRIQKLFLYLPRASAPYRAFEDMGASKNDNSIKTYFGIELLNAGVAELVYAPALGAGPARDGGSSPLPSTKDQNRTYARF